MLETTFIIGSSRKLLGVFLPLQAGKKLHQDEAKRSMDLERVTFFWMKKGSKTP